AAYGGAFDAAAGRYPAEDSHASVRAATAASNVFVARRPCCFPTRANARIAPTGRNHAIAHVPGPGPSASRARLVTLVVPTRDPRPAPPPESSVGTNGNSNTAAAARARPSSERPSTRDRPATRLTRTTTAMGRTRPGTNRHPPPGGASGPKATSRRSVAAGSTARQTRRSSRPSEKAHRTIADSPYATAAITAGPGRRVRRIAARYITTAARA